jgi:hypothetical protein
MVLSPQPDCGLGDSGHGQARGEAVLMQLLRWQKDQINNNDIGENGLYFYQ